MTMKNFLREPRALRMAVTLCAGLVQGLLIFFMYSASREWQWHTTIFLLPLPFYLARGMSKRLLPGLILWAALLFALDSAQVFFKNPYVYYFSSDSMTLASMAYAGALLLAPNFVSWIDGDGALPAWPVSFRHYSRIFFASAITQFFLTAFVSVGVMGAALITMLGGEFRLIIRWISKYFIIYAAAAFGCVFYWTAAADKLLNVLERYVLAVFSCILPFVSVFILLFMAALPLGIERLWRSGFNSGIILGLYIAAGFCAYAAWQGGAEDGESGRQPFFKPVNTLVKISITLLPLLCPILIYTFGLRVRQYGWTVDRAAGMTLSILFGLYSAAWAFSLIKKWKAWPSCYGKVNRIALPAIAAVLVLLSSPLCDARRVVLNERLDMLGDLPGNGKDVTDFDWRYVARNLGSYGTNAMENFAGEGGKAALEKILGPKATDEEIRQIQAAIRTELESAKKEKDTHDAWKDPAVAASQRDTAIENSIAAARSAPVFGGTMDEDGKERLARVFSEENLTNDNWRRYGAEAQNCFFYLADLNGDGEKEVLFGIGQDLFMIRDNRVFTLYQGWVKNGGRGLPDNMLAISADEQRIIKNEWASLVINSKIYSLDPSDAEEIASADKTR